jgi:hypothetical protein
MLILAHRSLLFGRNHPERLVVRRMRVSDRLEYLVCPPCSPYIKTKQQSFPGTQSDSSCQFTTCKSLLNRPCRRERVLSISNCRKPPLSSRDRARSRPPAPQSTPPPSYQGRCFDKRVNPYRATSGVQLCSRIEHHHHC